MKAPVAKQGLFYSLSISFMQHRFAILILLLLSATLGACRKEAATDGALVLNTLHKGCLYKIEKEITFPGTDSAYVFNGDSLYPGIPFLIEFNDTAVIIGNSCYSYLFNHFYTCNTLYHTEGELLYLNSFSSMYYNVSPGLFKVHVQQPDTILQSTDGKYQMYLRTKN